MFLFVQPGNPNTTCLKVFANLLHFSKSFSFPMLQLLFPVDAFECRRWHTFLRFVLSFCSDHAPIGISSCCLPSYLPTTELVSLTLFFFLFLSKMVIRQCCAVFYAFLTNEKRFNLFAFASNTTSLVFHSGTLRQAWSEAKLTILILLTFSFCICK